jgi:penicillin-binding protein 2
MKRCWILWLVLLLGTSACIQTPLPTPPGNLPASPTQAQAVETPADLTTPATALPSPTPTAFAPGADGVATAFLRAWNNGDYIGMYSLLSRTSQSMFDQPTFTERYLDAQSAATVLQVETRPLAILQDGEKAEVSFQLKWTTALLGVIERQVQMPLVYEGGRWAVSWSDALILPELGGGNRLQLDVQVPARANIYDREGLGLAVEGTAVTIGVVPGNIEDETTFLALMSQIFGDPPEEIQARYIASDPTWYVPLGDVPQEAVAPHLDALQPFINAGGLQLRERKTRLYRDGGVAPHVVGYAGAIPAEELEEWQAKGYRGDERVGISGLEAWGEPYLGGARGGTLYLVSPNGDRIGTILEVPARSNRSIYATIDKTFQIEVEETLAGAIATLPDGKAGAIMVMDVNNGQILALASYPDYDPNLFDPINPASASGLQVLLSDPRRPLVNRVAQGIYPPGSVFKIVTMSAAMLSGAYLPETRYTCTGTWAGLGPNYVKGDWLEGGHGNITLRQALTYSCDPYFYEVGLTLEHVDSFLIPETARAYGFGAPTGIKGLLEDGGIIPDPEWKLSTYADGWAPGDTVNMAIGQGFVAVTPLQVANMLAAVANGGTLYRPQVVQRIGEGGGAPEETLAAEVIGQLPVSAEQLAVIQESLYAVTTEKGGTAEHRFQNMPIPVAGKTGTAEVPPVMREDGTWNEEPTAWFAAYAPAAPTPDLPEVPDEPEIAIVVMIENAGEGSAVAAPIARRIVEIYYGVEPLAPYPW